MSILIIASLFTILGSLLEIAFFIYYKLYYYLFLILLAPVIYYLISIFIIGIMFLMFLGSKKRQLTYNILKEILYWFSRSIYNYRVKAINVPKKHDRPLILIGNHKEKIDPVFLINAYPYPISFTPKEELYHYIVLKSVFRKIKAIKIYRNDIRKTIKNLKIAVSNIKEQNISYVVFPEGGTHNKESEKIINSKKASYKIIKSANADILPFSIKNNLNFNKRKSKIEIYFHDIIPYEKIKDFTTQEIGDYVEPIVNSVL